MKTLLLLLFSVLIIGCPESPETSPTASVTPSPVETVAVLPDSSGHFALRLSSGASPGWFAIRTKGERTVEIEWDGGKAELMITSEQAKILADLAAEAAPLMEDKGDVPPYRVLSLHKGDSVTKVNLGTPKGGTLDELARLLESFLPSEVGLFENHTVGELEYRDLEGGFYQVTYDKDGVANNVVLHGTVPKELKGQQVLVTGTSSEGEMSLEMAGPTFEATQVVAWPPAGGYWQEGGIPEGLQREK